MAQLNFGLCSGNPKLDGMQGGVMRLILTKRKLCALAVFAAVAVVGPLEVRLDDPKTSAIVSLKAGGAMAQAPRGQARRVARRTARRVVRRNTLPAGCIRRGAYWYCGGVYYQALSEGGVTVYIVVNP